jgi:DNA (cytosine-5)-methyltransferase 1
MVIFPNGKVRYFTVREAALVQTFPKDFIFESSWTENMRQIGNAVPVRLAETIARSISKTLLQAQERQ